MKCVEDVLEILRTEELAVKGGKYNANIVGSDCQS
jgi:hypothetical protein